MPSLTVSLLCCRSLLGRFDDFLTRFAEASQSWVQRSIAWTLRNLVPSFLLVSLCSLPQPSQARSVPRGSGAEPPLQQSQQSKALTTYHSITTGELVELSIRAYVRESLMRGTNIVRGLLGLEPLEVRYYGVTPLSVVPPIISVELAVTLLSVVPPIISVELAVFIILAPVR